MSATGDPGPAQDKRQEERRKADRRRRRLTGILVGSLVLCALASLVSVVVSATALHNRATIKDVQGLVQRIEAESKDRRDQSCRQLERAEKQSIDQLAKTYDYLTGLTPAEREQPLNVAILRQVPSTEADARASKAPAFCREKGVGLDGPAPVLPKRPPGLLPPPPTATPAP